MISAAQMAAMQRTVEMLMQTPCTIQRQSSVPDGWGGVTDAWSTLLETTCQFAPERVGGSEQIAVGRIEAQDRVIVRLPVSLPAGVPDIKDRLLVAGGTLEVASVDAPRTIEIQRVAHCVQVVT